MKIKDDKYFILKNKAGEILVGSEFYSESKIKSAKLPLMLEIGYVSKETYEDIKDKTIFDGENYIKYSDLILVPVSLILDIK